jgi:hypothetical protein
MTQEKALIQLDGHAIGYIEMNSRYSILAEITTGDNITILEYKDVDNTIANVINNAKNIFQIKQNGIIGTIGIIQEYFNEDVWKTKITHKELPLINKKSGIQSSISVADKNTFITLFKEQQTEYGGGRRIKKRTRRHKKKRGKKTRGKRTRANRSNH